MTRSFWLSQIAVAVALCASVPSVARADSVPPSAVPAPRIIPVAPRLRRPPASDTAAKAERGKGERLPSARRRPVRGRNGTPAPAPVAPGSGGYVPDQPWETEFFVSNTLQDRRARYVRLASFQLH